jgi:integrin beta 3
VTRNGHTCQQWGPPHNSWTPENYPGKGLGDHGLRAHNYCRNPDDEPDGAWCYTTDGPRWEYCDVPECDSTCGTSAAKQSDYRGTISETINERTCQKWTSTTPTRHTFTPENYPGKGLGDHNYCRNPDDAPDGAWCYTTDGPRWEYCDVRTCRDGEAASKTSGTGSTPLIVLFCVLGAILLLGVLYLVRKRRVAAATPDETPQLDTEAQVEA